MGPTQPPVQQALGFFPGVERPGRDVNHPPPYSAEIKERVELRVTILLVWDFMARSGVNVSK